MGWECAKCGYLTEKDDHTECPECGSEAWRFVVTKAEPAKPAKVEPAQSTEASKNVEKTRGEESKPVTAAESPLDQIKKLKELLDSGAISKDEYEEEKKKRLLEMV